MPSGSRDIKYGLTDDLTGSGDLDALLDAIASSSPATMDNLVKLLSLQLRGVDNPDPRLVSAAQTALLTSTTSAPVASACANLLAGASGVSLRPVDVTGYRSWVKPSACSPGPWLAELWNIILRSMPPDDQSGLRSLMRVVDREAVPQYLVYDESLRTRLIDDVLQAAGSDSAATEVGHTLAASLIRTVAVLRPPDPPGLLSSETRAQLLNLRRTVTLDDKPGSRTLAWCSYALLPPVCDADWRCLDGLLEVGDLADVRWVLAAALRQVDKLHIQPWVDYLKPYLGSGDRQRQALVRSLVTDLLGRRDQALSALEDQLGLPLVERW